VDRISRIPAQLATASLLALSLVAVAQTPASAPQEQAAIQRNVILFVADGLRHDSISPELTPTIFSLRQQGVDFVNSHSIYPTFTTPNASVFATGHLLGDTGDFGNGLYVGYPISAGGTGGTLTPFIENDMILARINGHYEDNYLGEPTLAQLAREKGYSVAVVGKVGPIAIQDIGEIKLDGNALAAAEATIVDDATGVHGVPLPDQVRNEMNNASEGASAPDRSNGMDGGSRGSNGRTSGTMAANLAQQQYFVGVLTQAILPVFKKNMNPFFVVYWSRDPDGTQHYQGDSLDQLVPGINGPTSQAAVRNADNNLWQIIQYLKAADLYANTDIIVVADHGFSTISKKEISRTAVPTAGYAATKSYADVKQGYLPPGFLAIDLAHALKKPLYDPDGAPFLRDGINYYPPVSVCDCEGTKFIQRPSLGNGLIGGGGKVPGNNEITDAEIVIAANGGSDLIYLPQRNMEANRELALKISDFLLRQDYVDGVFVHDDLGDLPGTLPLSAIGLKGASKLPAPAIVVAFKTFSLSPGQLLSRVEIADSTLQEGQGMHGSFSRADTFNAMVAFGPDFKSGYVDNAPSSNADIAVTIASLLKLDLPPANGSLRGRVLRETIKTGPDTIPFTPPVATQAKRPGPDGKKTVLFTQTVGSNTYFDQACVVEAGAPLVCR
jgi:arylsulfatase A-like enzyme